MTTAPPSTPPSLFDRLAGRGREPRPDHPVVVLRDVTMRYPNGKEALRDVDLVVPEGDFVFLVGPSGAGKSTLMKLLIRDELATHRGDRHDARNRHGEPPAAAIVTRSVRRPYLFMTGGGDR